MMYFCWLSAFHIKDILLISAGKALQKRWRFAICLYMAMATIEIEIDTGSTWIENEGGGVREWLEGGADTPLGQNEMQSIIGGNVTNHNRIEDVSILLPATLHSSMSS